LERQLFKCCRIYVQIKSDLLFKSAGFCTRQARKEILIEQRGLLAERIAEMQVTLKKLDSKIANYDTAVFEYEKKLS
jgi:hypothetical protein